MPKLKQISDGEIADARDVLDRFVARETTRASALESGIYAVANQGSMWEKAPARFLRALRKNSWKDDKDYMARYSSEGLLVDPKRVEQIAADSGWRFRHNNRFAPFIERYQSKGDGWWSEIPAANNEYRLEEVKEVKWLALKTFSFWHLCMGGQDLLPIDVHISRRLAKDFDFDIQKKYFEGRRRRQKKKLEEGTVQGGLFGEHYDHRLGGTQSVRDLLPEKDYLRVEDEARKFFSKDKRFLKNGRIDMGLLAAVLWWRGAERGGPTQLDMFDSERKNIDVLPYGDMTRFKVNGD